MLCAQEDGRENLEEGPLDRKCGAPLVTIFVILTFCILGLSATLLTGGRKRRLRAKLSTKLNMMKVNNVVVLNPASDQQNRNSLFGISVALTNKHAIVGAPGVSKAYIFENHGTQPTATILGDGENGTAFGAAVGITDTFCIVGAYGARKAYIFVKQKESWQTTPLAILSETEEKHFGVMVSITDSYAVVGVGSARVFVYNKVDRGRRWVKTKASPTKGPTTFLLVQNSGRSVAMTNTFTLVGSPNAGKAYLMEKTKDFRTPSSGEKIQRNSLLHFIRKLVGMTDKFVSYIFYQDDFDVSAL